MGADSGGGSGGRKRGRAMAADGGRSNGGREQRRRGGGRDGRARNARRRGSPPGISSTFWNSVPTAPAARVANNVERFHLHSPAKFLGSFVGGGLEVDMSIGVSTEEQVPQQVCRRPTASRHSRLAGSHRRQAQPSSHASGTPHKTVDVVPPVAGQSRREQEMHPYEPGGFAWFWAFGWRQDS